MVGLIQDRAFFDNQIATLELEDRSATITFEKAALDALRGAGGGNFGMVTSLAFETVPAPAATAFHLNWPVTRACAAIDSWQAWALFVPDELAASLLLTAPDDPEEPHRRQLLRGHAQHQIRHGGALPDPTRGRSRPRRVCRRKGSWLARSWAIVRPWGSGCAYQNFPDPDLEDWARPLRDQLRTSGAHQEKVRS